MTLWEATTTVDDWLHAHRRAVAGVSVAAFVLSCAHYAGFLRLPEFWHLPARFAWILPALRYGVWEATVTPKLNERRARLEGKTDD